MNTSIYNNTFLNSLFTAEEFNFVKNLDSDSQEFDNILEKEVHYRDSIVKFISSLKETILNGSELQGAQQLSNTLEQAQHCFELANQSIKETGITKKAQEEISQQIVELLIKIDSEGSNISESKFYTEISNVKNEISKFSNQLNEYKSTIAFNDMKINNFLNDTVVKKYLPTTYSSEEETPRMDTAYTYINLKKDKFEVPQGMKEENDTLLVSERERKVYLPYSKKEVVEYLEQYPDQYRSFVDVVRQEFIFPIDFYLKHPAIARFRETYSLIRDRESKSIVEAFKLAMDTMFKYDLNPAIIAACKSEDQLEKYLDCLSKKKTNEFTDFKIQFDVTPLKA